jgi:hypothetical protein
MLPLHGVRAIAQTASEHSISGVIRDGSTNQPLPLASVSIKGASLTTDTDEQGKYSLQLPVSLATDKVTVIIRAVGYKTEQRVIPLTNSTKDIATPKRFYLAVTLLPVKYLLQEVSVFSRNNNNNDKTPDIEKSGLLSISGETVQKTGGMLKDALRAVQTMPGAIGTNELSARVGVRGGSQDENLVLINGTQVFEPYHIKYAGMASIGVFNTDLVKSINLVNGGYSAEYGDRMSSVLNIQYRDGSRDRVKGQFGLSLTNVDALVEGPLGERGSFIIGARQSFVEYLLKVLGFAENIHPSFYDVQGQASYNLSSYDKLTFQFVHSGDRLKVDPTEQIFQSSWRQQVQGKPTDISRQFSNREDVNAQYGSTMLNLRSSNVLSNAATLRTEIAFYDQNDNVHFADTEIDTREGVSAENARRYTSKYSLTMNGYNRLTIRTLEARSIADVQIAPIYQLRVGAGYQNITYKQDLEVQDQREEYSTFSTFPDTSRRRFSGERSLPLRTINGQSFKLNGFIENVLQVDESLILNIGGRVDYFDINQDLNISPRVNASYTAPFGVTFRGAWGLYYQSPLYQQLISTERSDTNTKAQRATHYILSAERRFDLGFIGADEASLTLKVDFYHKQYDRLISSLRNNDNSVIDNGGVIYPTRRNDAQGFARGVDMFVAFAWGRLNGWVSYGLLDAQEDLLTDTLGYYPRFTDQRHALAFVADYDLGNGWSAGLRFTYGSGNAYTPLLEQYNAQTKTWSWQQGSKHSAYLPAYQRLDVRMDKRFEFFGLKATAFLDVSNVLNRQNVIGYSYGFDNEGKPTRRPQTLWPIVPTLGLTVAF